MTRNGLICRKTKPPTNPPSIGYFESAVHHFRYYATLTRPDSMKEASIIEKDNLSKNQYVKFKKTQREL